MESAGKRKRATPKPGTVDNSLISDFLELKNTSIVQTGPKRPKTGGVVPLTPATDLKPKHGRPSARRKRPALTPRPLKKRIPAAVQVEGEESTPRTELTEAVQDLIKGAADMLDLTPAPNTLTTLTPTPAPQRRSARLSGLVATPSVHETSKPQLLKSSLKDVRRLSTLRKSQVSGDSRVSFGNYVTITEYSPEKSFNSSSTGGEQSPRAELQESAERTQAPAEVDLDLNDSEMDVALVNEPETSDIHVHVHVDEDVALISEPETSGRGGGIDEPGVGVALEPIGDEEEEDAYDEEEELSDDETRLKTPQLPTASPTRKQSPNLATPDYEELRQPQKPQQKRRRKETVRQVNIKKRKPAKTLPRTLIKNLFTLSSKKRVTKDAMDLVMKFSEVYLKQASEDLSVYARHAGRKTVDVDDVILLLKRQRMLTGKETFEYLVNTHLPMEYVQELLPCAVAGKSIVPEIKRYAPY